LDIFSSVQGVEEQYEVFEYVEEEAGVNHPTDEVFGLRGDKKSVVAEDTGDGHDRNHQTANLQDQLNAVLVVHNVDAEFPVVLVVIAEQTH
jgi:hypothetical protein